MHKHGSVRPRAAAAAADAGLRHLQLRNLVSCRLEPAGLWPARRPPVAPHRRSTATGDYPSLRGSIHVFWTFVGYVTEEDMPKLKKICLTICFLWRPLPSSHF